MNIRDLIEELNAIEQFALEEKAVHTTICTYFDYIEVTLTMSDNHLARRNSLQYLVDKYSKWGLKDNIKVLCEFNDLIFHISDGC